MRSAFFSLLAIAQAVYVTETDYATFFVTVNADGQAIPGATTSTSISRGTPSTPSSTATPTTSSTSSIETPNFAYVTNSPSHSYEVTTSAEASAAAATTTTSSSHVVPTTSSKVTPAPSTPASTTTSAAPSSSSTSSPFEQDILNYHNRVRAEHHVGPLSWNDELASFAQNYLQGDNCVFKHSGGPYGENIALGFSTIDEALDAWYNEEDQYNYAAGQFSEATGHFTQMVWKATSEVGCATYDCSGRTFLVCEYKERGNVIGYFTENVLPK